LIILQPNPADPAILRRVLRSALALALMLAGGVAVAAIVLLACGVARIGAVLLVFAVVSPMLLGQDLWRAISFGVHRPDRALANDIGFTVVQVGAMGMFIALGFTSAPWFVLAWGLGAAFGLGLGFLQFRALPPISPGLGALRDLWGTSRWLLWDFLTLFAARESYLLVVAAMVTAAELGGLRAAESLLGPSVVILLAGGNVGLPGATSAFRGGGSRALARYSNRLTLGVGAVQWIFCAVMAAIGPWLLVELYGPEFEPYAYLVPILALRYALAVTSFGPSVANKVAGLVREMFLGRLAVAVISLPTVVVITARYGLAGGAWASVAFTGALVAVLYWVYVPGVLRAAAPGGFEEDAPSLSTT
jgi:O-antigen/teichoic acid export membrane protein